MRKSRFSLIAPVMALVILATACDDSTEPEVASELQTSRSPVAAEPSIVDIALSNENFETLVAAVAAADLVETLDGRRHFTVFAPTDDAFAALGLNPDNVGDLPKDQLRDILLYHVTNGDRFSQSVLEAERIRMLNGGFIFVDGTTLITPNNTAQLVLSLVDIDARNGVIHVIDAVLLP